MLSIIKWTFDEQLRLFNSCQYCTSLQVFPASDVMNILTFVLVSSGPITPKKQIHWMYRLLIVGKNLDYDFLLWTKQSLKLKNQIPDNRHYRVNNIIDVQVQSSFHLMLWWFQEPNLCWQCFPRCKDSLRREGADVESSKAEEQRHKED